MRSRWPRPGDSWPDSVASEVSDLLAKRLVLAIQQAAMGDSTRRRFLRDAGLYDFLNHDRPETDDAVEMAIGGFLYLATTEDGAWVSVPFVLEGVFVFLEGEGCGFPTPEGFGALANLVDESIVDREKVAHWFRITFGPDR